MMSTNGRNLPAMAGLTLEPSLDVSVVLAVKNEQTYIESAIQSVLSQVGLDYEVVVVDDGSTDTTYSILVRLALIHPRLRVYRNPRAGKCSAFNFGVNLAAGRFVCIFAGDDIMPKGSLAARFQAVRGLPDDVPGIGLCKLITMSDLKRLDGQLIPRAPKRGALSGVSPLMNRPALDKIFPVPEELPNEDTWMELAVLHFSSWNIRHSDIIGCKWRIHSGNSMNLLVGFEEYNRRIVARMRALNIFLKRFESELSEAEKSKLLAKIECEIYRASGDMIGVIRGRSPLVEKLRALSITNSLLYSIRQRFFKLLSGW